MSGNRSSSTNVNKDILVKELGFKQYRNTTIFTKQNYFVLSPSVQNDANWFDIRKVNLDKFAGHSGQGYLLIRFFDQFLVTSLSNFIDQIIDQEKYANTANSGIHWKFRVLKTLDGYRIKSMINKKEVGIKQVHLENLCSLFI